MKFNYTVDPSAQRFSQFESFIRLKNDDYFEIINKKPADSKFLMMNNDNTFVIA